MSDQCDISVRCDLHIHSALSPCSDDEMTPGNIVGMAILNKLDIIAITDHQSCGNCEAAMIISEQMHGPLIIPGIEAASAEEIHLLCLFPDLARAFEFQSIIRKTQIRKSNRPDIFGNQSYYNEHDEIIGTEDQLLIMPSRLSCDEIAVKVFSMGGACLPAHIDREANSMLNTLGSIPEDFSGSWIEFSRHAKPEYYFDNYPDLRRFRWLVDSDAHRLEDIADPGWPMRLPGFCHNDQGRRVLIDKLRSC